MNSKMITKYVYAFSPDNEPVEKVKGETLVQDIGLFQQSD